MAHYNTLYSLYDNQVQKPYKSLSEIDLDRSTEDGMSDSRKIFFNSPTNLYPSVSNSTMRDNPFLDIPTDDDDLFEFNVVSDSKYFSSID